MSSGATPLARRFLRVGGRRVHYFRAGEGPPAVLIHSSPANARLLFKEIERLSCDFTVFAFDTPGFGLSEPLPLDTMTVADLADAMAETLDAIAMPRCPVYGTHTGAAIALELGVRHPQRVTVLVLDGVPAFTDAECDAFFGDYFRPLALSDLGGHYADTWTRFRDQSIWFPWSERRAKHLNSYDLSPPHSTHLWVAMYYEAAEHYTPAYRAASFYGARAIAAAHELTIPAVFTATDTDMLHPHLDRLPPLGADQAIVEIGSSNERKRELIAETFARYGADGAAPPHVPAIDASPGIARQFVDGARGQVHLRYAGDRANPALLLVHDAPGSSEQAEPLIARLTERFFVVAPDLPGSGESDALAEDVSVDAFADGVAGLLGSLGIDRAIVYGVGFGSSVALAVAARHPSAVAALVLQGVLLPDAAERRSMRERYAPPIEIEADGGHWYRTWLMLRDSLVYWPWYDRRLATLRRVDADFSARPLHRWTMDVMRARSSYMQVIHAALDQNAEALLGNLPRPPVLVEDPDTPISVYNARLRGVRADCPALSVSAAGFVDLLACRLSTL